MQDPEELYVEEEFISDDDLDRQQEQELQSLGHKLRDLFQEYKDARKGTNEWLKDLRQYAGQYEPEVLARLNEHAGARSKVFVGLTRTKVMAAYSRIVDLLFQHGDLFFAVQPTPIATIDPVLSMQMRKQAIEQVTMASGMDPMANQDLIAARMKELEEEFRKVEQKMSEEAAKNMTVEIEDQLVEAGADQKLKESILEACIFGSGAVKAGTVRIDTKQSYSKIVDPESGAQAYALSVVETPVPDKRIYFRLVCRSLLHNFRRL